MKKILIASGVAVMAFAMVAGAQSAVFTSNLTVGSTGTQVVALQNALMAAGFTIPAIASGAAQPGYFGAQTQAAVKLYQASKGIPNTGFVGPLTRGALNGTAAPVAGFVCPIGYSCVANPGTVVTPGTPGGITTAGAEGLITTKLAPNPISDANIRASSNVPVYGIEVRAQGSDMIVDRVLLQMQVGVGGAATNVANPATFVRTLSAYDGSTLLKSWTLSASDFNKDSSDRYYVIASGLKFVVPKDATKVITFKVDTTGIASDMSARYLTVQGYAGNTQNVRAIDGAGMNSYTDMSGSSNSRVQVFNTSGSSSLTVTTNSSLTPKSATNKVDTTDGVKKLTMQVIDVKSTTGASVIKSMYVAVNATATAGLPSTLYLYDGSELIGSASAGSADGAQSGFTDLNVLVGQDQTKQLTIKADFPTTAVFAAASTSIPATGVKFEKPDSTTASTTNSEIAGNDQYLYTAAPQWTLVSKTMKSTAAGYSGASSTLEGTIILRATALGGAMTKPVVGDFSVVFASSTQTAYTAANSISVTPTITVTPTDATVSEGAAYTIEIKGVLASSNSSLGTSQSLFMAIKDIDSVVGGVTITNQTWGLTDFITEAAYIAK